MNEQEIEAIVEYAQNVEKYNKRFYTLCLVIMGIMLITVVCGLVTINSINTHMANMSEKQWELYMEADYYYPDIYQEQKVEVK